MLQSRVFVSGLLIIGAVACGGSVRVDGAAGGSSGSDAGTGNSPNYAGASSAGSGSAGSGSAGDGSCTQQKIWHANHTTWACDCNTCSCSDGQISSTLAACYTCKDGDTGYFAGQSVPSRDGCNTCMCEDTGDIRCTEQLCLCDPATDWGKKYVLTDPMRCASADTPPCPANTTPFQNECGCGCAQGSSCPEWINCLPSPQANDCATLAQTCPYSKLAL